MANINDILSRTILATGDDKDVPMDLGDLRALVKQLDGAPDDCLVAVSGGTLSFTTFGREYMTFTDMAVDVPQPRDIVAL